MPRITIAIPTYDRNEKLIICLESLLANRDHCDDVEVLVMDNASPRPVAETIAKCLPNFSIPLRIVRNVANLGAGANLLKCFEEARGEWLWIVGDDDAVRDDSFETVKRAVAGFPRALAINFSSVHGRHDETREFVGRRALLQGIERVGGYFFISTNVFHRSALLSELRIGYVYNYSMISVFCMVLSAMDNGGSVVELTDSVVDVTDPNEWSPTLYYLSTMVAIESVPSEEDRRMLWSLIYRPGFLRYVALDAIMRAANGQPGEAAFMFDQLVFRNTYYLPVFSVTRLAAKVCRQVLRVPRISFAAIRLSAAITGRPKLYVSRQNDGEFAPSIHRRN